MSQYKLQSILRFAMDFDNEQHAVSALLDFGKWPENIERVEIRQCVGGNCYYVRFYTHDGFVQFLGV